MPPKAKTPVPIDRPLSKAYLRGFTGWSTAYSPGHSDPASLRIMENMAVDRNGALRVRAGLKYLSYAQAPDTDPLTPAVEGIAIDRPLVGMQEPFYTSDGSRALLFAVRETDDTVGFRAILFTDAGAVVKRLTDDEIGFSFPQGETNVRFSANTVHVEYLQIDNKIIAMSNSTAEKGEDIRMFLVGAEKIGKRLNSISQPDWADGDKLTVVHPDSAWVLDQGTTTRRNEIYNPSFEVGGEYWTPSSNCSVRDTTGSAVSGGHKLELSSLPARTNLQTSPLHNVASTGTAGWNPHPDWGNPKLSKDGSYMKVYEPSQKTTFLAYGAKLSYGVKAGQKYRVAVDYEIGTHVEPITVLTFYNASGAKIGSSTSLAMPRKNGRYSSPAVLAPNGTVTMRVSLGGRNEKASSTFVKFKNVVLCKDGESTAMFHGSSGTNYFWTGATNASASVYHPAVDITLTSMTVPIRAGSPFWASLYVSCSVVKSLTLYAQSFDKDSVAVNTWTGTGSTTAGGWVRVGAGTSNSAVNAVKARMQLKVAAVARGQKIYVDAALLESGVASAGTYFDGTTAPTTSAKNKWADPNKPHRTYSIQTVTVAPKVIPPAETATANTLIKSGGAAANAYHIGFFYTFENEVGESAPSKITEVRTQRPWSNWIWEKPNAAGEPGGASLATQVAELCADQLVAYMPQATYDQAVREGAIRWNLYAFAWSDQEAVPVVAQMINSVQLYPDETSILRAPAQTYNEAGWLQITPARRIGLNDTVLPTQLNRVNYSVPPRARTGLVAGDRIILLGDPVAGLATIRWSSNRPGEYTNFTASRGGGSKTLTSGNLNIPAAVALWQNPQSVDTLTILCMAADGRSVSYYMQPATVSGQSGSTTVMGFEETTSTPGTVSPYAPEVTNNALFRPTERALLKSTAQNYNINHKTLTDNISNRWRTLRNKEWIMSAVLDNHLFYLVHNPYGELLEDGCRGNEIWVFDLGSEAGIWSRFLIQASALRVFNVGTFEHLGITRPEGLYYLDLDAREDDYVVTDWLVPPTDTVPGTPGPDHLKVRQRPIPWAFETNTQGANKAHDAWAHLQQLQVTVGNFIGTMQYGIRGKDVNGTDIEVVKEFTDMRQASEDGLPWDVDDILQVRRDMKEWFLFGSSVPGKTSWGRIGYVQYRYTPVSVNVGYEFGSIETFDYGLNTESGPNGYSDNGIPLPYLDYTRP